MVDIEAAMGFVMARGDQVDRARLSWLRSEVAPQPDVVAKVELGQTAGGGWPAAWGESPSIDATCFRLTELDDIGALGRPAARKALAWLAGRQRRDGTWQEDEALADVAPAWAKPGDPEASLYLTANAGFWLGVAGPIAATSAVDIEAPAGAETPGGESRLGSVAPGAATPFAEVVARSTQAFRAALRPDGTWPSFLVTGWLGAALLYRTGFYYEAAQIQVVLGERAATMSAADVAWMAATFRRVGLSDQDYVMQAARRRLGETQGSDGGWQSDDGEAFDVHTTLAAIRALR